jgi:CRP-like cAMP-binding protein
MKSGDSFGELAIITDAPRSATITATEPSEFAILYKNDYERVIKKVEA